MFKFFDYIVSFFQNIGNFIQNAIESINTMLQVLLSLQWIPVQFSGSVIPAIISTSLTLVATIGIFKLVLGWGNS